MTNQIGDAGDVLVGADAIARATGFKRRQVFYLAARGEIPGAFKLGSQLAMSQSAYRAGLASKIAAASRQIAA